MRKTSSKRSAQPRRARVANRQKLPAITLAPISAQDIRRIVARLKEDETDHARKNGR
jgi:hypothetical protein